MRIGIFSDTYFPDINGVVTSLETLRLGLIERGHEVFVVANHNKLFELEHSDHLLLLPGVELKWTFNNKMSIPYNLRAEKIIESMKLDIIHVQTEFGIGLLARRMAKKLNIPLVYTYHTTWEDYTHYINPMHMKTIEKGSKNLVAILSKSLCKPARFVVTPSLKTKELLVGYGVKQAIKVIPTGLDLNRFRSTEEGHTKRLEIQKKYKLNDDQLVLIFVGRIGEEKGLDILIDAFVNLSDINVKLLIVGGGPQLKSYQDLIVDKGVQQQIILTDKVPNSEVPYYYQLADAFVSASMTETQGLTFIEAMASGCPVLGSDPAVLEELVISGETGFLFKGSIELELLIRKLNSMSDDELSIMKMRAVQQVKPFDKEYFVKAIEELYVRAIANEG